MRPPATRALIVFAALLSVLALVQAIHKARQGRCAILKWEPEIEALTSGGVPYGRDEETLDEGFPLLPIAALALVPFVALGGVPGATVWALLKIGLTWWMLAAALRLARGSRPWPALASMLVVLLSLRVLLSDVAHGNVNIVVGATVVASAVSWSRGRDLSAGLWAGLGAALKVTPALLLLYFLWKRSARGSFGFAIGLALAVLAVPAVFLGWSQNLALASAWWEQMIGPYLAGAPPTIVQTQQINQSYLGVLARLTTASVAIDGDPPVSINVMALPPETLRLVLLAATIATLAALAFCLRPRASREAPTTLGEYSMLALAMLFLSERSWKHHWVLVALPFAFLISTFLDRGLRDPPGRTSVFAVTVAALLFGLTGSGVLGPHGSDLAEAYGAFLLGGLALFVACGRVLRSG